jgi:acetoin utilization deacetylase AcuC-like enzyme
MLNTRVRRTGVFFHYQQGERLSDFPEALGELLEQPTVFLYDAFYPGKPEASYDLEPVPSELLLEVHSPSLIERVKRTPYYETALFSAGGTVQAAVKIREGEIDNAFVFTGCGDHHAGRDFFGGWCFLNGAALAIRNLRKRYAAGRFAIIDTDPHHGDGTWSLFAEDEEVLYLCFCDGGFVERKNNINIPVPRLTTDADYLDLVAGEVRLRCPAFQPELIFWNWGYDGTRGEYGDTGLSRECHLEIARLLKAVAEEVCHGRLIVILCGGHSREIARYAIPRIIRCLAGLEEGAQSK